MEKGKRIFRAGVRFDCPMCGRLLRDDEEHAEILPRGCLACQGDLRLVGVGASPFVGDACWYRCVKCKALFMRRRGAIVATQPRSGFRKFTEF